MSFPPKTGIQAWSRVSGNDTADPSIQLNITLFLFLSSVERKIEKPVDEHRCSLITLSIFYRL